MVLPGLVDAHVHINEPGRTEWEGFLSATEAAAAGGTTTLVDMPLNSIPATTSNGALETKMAAARGRLHVDCAFWGGVVPGNAAELGPLVDAGVAGFKCFLVPSGVDEFAHVGEAELREAMPILARRGVPLLVHAELASPVDGRRRSARLRHLPGLAARGLGERCHPPHGPPVPRDRLRRPHRPPLVGGGAARARRRRAPKACPSPSRPAPTTSISPPRTCPKGRTDFKCSPPIRERANRERLWAGLAAGTIDMVVSDHSPCTPHLKRLETGDFLQAWGGIASLQFRLPVAWTEAQRRGHGLDDLARWLCEKPAALAGLSPRKGRIAPGQDADLVLFDPDAELQVEPEARPSPAQAHPLRGRAAARCRASHDPAGRRGLRRVEARREAGSDLEEKHRGHTLKKGTRT